jgi:hypothetical protein
MAATLESLRERVSVTLMDPDRLIWGDAALQEAVRLALGEYRLAGGSAQVAGLDGAGTTTLPELHEPLIVLGAAGHAGAMRAVDRVEAFDGEREAPALVQWADARLLDFRQLLRAAFAPAGAGEQSAADERARQAALHTSTNPPWGAWAGWEEEV